MAAQKRRLDLIVRDLRKKLEFLDHDATEQNWHKAWLVFEELERAVLKPRGGECSHQRLESMSTTTG